jgi:thioredoxin-like negative regulator of GroEL
MSAGDVVARMTETDPDPDTQTQTEARPVHLDDEQSLDALVASRPTVLVSFHTEGCGICASMEPVLGNVARATDVAVGVVNPRDDPPLVERFDVRSVPLLVLFVDGEPVARRADGFVGAEDLLDWLARER